MEGVASAEAAYATLGLRWRAPQEEVRSAYRALLRQYHPDTGTHQPEAIRRLTEVRAAYERLRTHSPAPDPVARERALDAYAPARPSPGFEVFA